MTKPKKIHHWMVYSPPYESGGYYNGWNLEPPEYGADVVEVDAYTKREAIQLGVKKMLKDYYNGWCNTNIGDGSPPWKGIKAEIMACVHGTESTGCPACDYEYAAQLRSGYIPEY